MDNYDYSDSENSLEDIQSFETKGGGPSEEEENHVNNVRSAIKEWKSRELDKASEMNEDPASFDRLQVFLKSASRLLYDLLHFIRSAKNNEENMKDQMYVKIIGAIGAPADLTSFERIHIEDILNRDLVELPFTVNPTLINAHAKKGIKIQPDFLISK